MGGLFRAPKPVETAPPSDQQQASAVAANQAEATLAAEAAKKTARASTMDRARRGLPGTIVTGPRGVLAPLPAAAVRKTLLGE